MTIGFISDNHMSNLPKLFLYSHLADRNFMHGSSFLLSDSYSATSLLKEPRLTEFLNGSPENHLCAL